MSVGAWCKHRPLLVWRVLLTLIWPCWTIHIQKLCHQPEHRHNKRAACSPRAIEQATIGPKWVHWLVYHYMCLCVYMPECCGTQVQNINHYESALPIPLSKILYFKATNHSALAANWQQISSWCNICLRAEQSPAYIDFTTGNECGKMTYIKKRYI